MAKIELPVRSFFYPKPVTIVGAIVEGKANFITIAHIGIMNERPVMIGMGMNRAHYTNKGIIENESFSVNVPSSKMALVTDYCGLASGKRTDKSGLFEVFYGRLGNAPLIKECPLNLECRLVQTLELGNTDGFIGEVVSVFADEEILTDNIPDVEKLDAFSLSMPDNNYWRTGEKIGKAWSIGKGHGSSGKGQGEM